jgi:hypothetical protein
MKLAPVLLSTFLIIWTLIVYPYSKYGDKWAIYPALVVLPLTLLVHAWLVVTNKPRLGFVVYGFGHGLLQAVLWIYCLMRIGKDSI